MRPFEGIRVLDLTRVVSGPYCTQILGYLGAEIVKIEDRAGDSTRQGPGDAALKKDGMAATFLMFNSGKKSITLDLKKPEAKEIVMKLARTADVFVENFRPGVVTRLGLGYDALRKENPKLVYCSISGFGQTGPDSAAPAFDGNIQAMSGMMAMTGEPDGSPMRAGYSVCDTTTGLNAAVAICAALYQRNHTDQGQFIDVAMLDSAISLASQTIGSWLNGGHAQPRRANLSVSREPIGDSYQTADGSIMLAIMRDEHVKIFLRVLGHENLCRRRPVRLARDPRGQCGIHPGAGTGRTDESDDFRMEAAARRGGRAMLAHTGNFRSADAAAGSTPQAGARDYGRPIRKSDSHAQRAVSVRA